MELLNSLIHLAYLASLMSILDISLTYFTLWWDKKLNPEKPRFREINVVAKFIMDKLHSAPLALIAGAIQAQTLLWGAIWLLLTFSTELEAIVCASIFVGALTTVNMIHFANISELRKMSKVVK